MEDKEKKKRIRHPKNKVEEQDREEKKHFVLDVHSVSTSNKSKIGS